MEIAHPNETLEAFQKVPFHAYLSRLMVSSRAEPAIACIKIADQCDNLGSIDGLREEKQEKFKVEIREYFLPAYEKLLASLRSKGSSEAPVLLIFIDKLEESLRLVS